MRENIRTSVFQSTLPHGERRTPNQGSCDHETISIHAPTRGATQALRTDCIVKQFQSTLPHGERPCCSSSTANRSYFNPRSHTGSDEKGRALCEEERISIHAPTRGATNYIGQVSEQEIFQSTLPHGERQQYYTKISHIFIHM